jgi:hypothetical protein
MVRDRKCRCMCSLFSPSSHKATRVLSWGFHPDDLCNPNHLPKPPPLTTLVGLISTLLQPLNGDKISVHEPLGDTLKLYLNRNSARYVNSQTPPPIA